MRVADHVDCGAREVWCSITRWAAVNRLHPYVIWCQHLRGRAGEDERLAPVGPGDTARWSGKVGDPLDGRLAAQIDRRSDVVMADLGSRAHDRKPTAVG